MKNIVLITLSLLIFNNYSSAQKVLHYNLDVSNPSTTLTILKLTDGTQITTKDVIVSFKEIDSKDGELVPPGKIKQYTDDNTITSVVIFKLLPGVKLLNLKQILNKYHINNQYRTYKVLTDDIPINDKNKLWVSESQIDEILIYPDQQYLDIRTKNYANYIKMKKESQAQRLKNIEEYKNLHPPAIKREPSYGGSFFSTGELKIVTVACWLLN